MLLFLTAFVSFHKIKKADVPFEGVLTYQLHYVDKWFGTQGEVHTTIYEAPGKFRIEAYDTSYNKPDLTIQNPLLIDVQNGTETHLAANMQRAVVYSVSSKNKMTQSMESNTHTVYNIENIGQDTVNNFTCRHYRISKSYEKLKTLPPAIFDIWITKDLGSGSIWYIGDYLYLYPGMDLFTKLAKEGADGVVVKWQLKTKGVTTCLLTSHWQTDIPNSKFLPPSNYSLFQMPGMNQ